MPCLELVCKRTFVFAKDRDAYSLQVSCLAKVFKEFKQVRRAQVPQSLAFAFAFGVFIKRED